MSARPGVVGPLPAASPAVDRASLVWPAVVSVLGALLVLGPSLAPGQVLLRDMVIVPHPALDRRLLGLGHEAPRAVPSDLVVALASHVLPAGIVQSLVLLGVLLAAGIGAARLVPRGALPGSAAALVAVWNPYVAERLLMGQWALLVGYGACAWVLLGTARVARGHPGRLPLVLGLVLGALGGGAAWLLLVLTLLGAATGVAVATRQVGAVVVRVVRWVPLVAAFALPWAVPAVLRPGGLESDPAGFGVFAPGADTVLGKVGSLLTGGGTWNVAAVPPGRGTVVGAVAALTLLGWSVAGLWLTRRGQVLERHPVAASLRAPVLGAGVLGLGVALVSLAGGSLGPLAGVPGGGLLRDGARELAPWLLLLAVGAGWGAAWVLAAGLPRAAAALVALLPVVALPALGWGASGALTPVRYPPGVLAVAAASDAASGSGSLVVLPFEATRRYPWNGNRPSATPWSRLVQRRVVASSDLVVATPDGMRTVAGEDRYAADVRGALADPDAARRLSGLGVGWLLVDASGVVVPDGAVRVVTTTDATLYRLPGVPVPESVVSARYDPAVVPVLAGDLIALAAAVLALGRATRDAKPGPGAGRTAPTFG